MIITIFFVLILFSALFAGSETAIFSLRESQVRLMKTSKAPNAHIIERLKRDPHRVLVTILFANTVINVLVGAIAASIVVDESNLIGVGVITTLVTILLLIFGEIFPKSFAISHNKRVAQLVAYPIYGFYILLYPITALFVVIEKMTKRMTRGSVPDGVTEEEIRIMSDLGVEHGGIDRDERKLIDNIFKFDNIPVGKAMTAKDKIDAVNGNVPVTQIAYYVSQSGFSRFPIYEGSPTNYTGYVHTNDVMRVLNSDDREELLVGYASPLTWVPEDMDIRAVFRKMTKDRSHMYLVHKKDDPEEVVGLVTMEDILEEIMGEIEDEGDYREEHGT